MKFTTRALLIVAALCVFPRDVSSAPTAHAFRHLNVAEGSQLSHASRFAAHNRPGSLHRLSRHPDISWAGLSPGVLSSHARFRTSAAGTAIGKVPFHAHVVPHQHFAARWASHDAPAPQALVLEPFGIELGLGVDSGRPEIDALLHAGFQVDVYRESAVTIPIIESMARYAVVYMESHSGTCGPPLCKQDDVFVLTGVQVTGDVNQYASLFHDGSMTEGSPDTNPGAIYLAFTSQLISQHVGMFANSSIVFINGCDLLATPTFLHALSNRGAATIYTWNKKVYSFDAEPTADFIFGRLTAGETVSAALSDARAAQLGTSLADEGASLALAGDPDNSFARARDHATPTLTPSVSPTPTGTATVTATTTPTPQPPKPSITIKQVMLTGRASLAPLPTSRWHVGDHAIFVAGFRVTHSDSYRPEGLLQIQNHGRTVYSGQMKLVGKWLQVPVRLSRAFYGQPTARFTLTLGPTTAKKSLRFTVRSKTRL